VKNLPCSLDWPPDFQTACEFIKVLAKLRGTARRLVSQDEILRGVLVLEFRTRHHNIDSLVNLCKLVSEFFAPLLKAAKVDLPAKLLQTSYETVLTKRLLYYNKDLQKKA
jgi:hypothetical protein